MNLNFRYNIKEEDNNLLIEFDNTRVLIRTDTAGSMSLQELRNLLNSKDITYSCMCTVEGLPVSLIEDKSLQRCIYYNLVSLEKLIKNDCLEDFNKDENGFYNVYLKEIN